MGTGDVGRGRICIRDGVSCVGADMRTKAGQEMYVVEKIREDGGFSITLMIAQWVSRLEDGVTVHNV